MVSYIKESYIKEFSSIYIDEYISTQVFSFFLLDCHFYTEYLMSPYAAHIASTLLMDCCFCGHIWAQ